MNASTLHLRVNSSPDGCGLFSVYPAFNTRPSTDHRGVLITQRNLQGLPFSIVSKFVNLDAESYYRRQIILPFFQSSSLIGSFVSRGQCVETGMQMKLDDLAKFPLILFLCSILYSIQYTTWRIFTARKSPLVRIFTSWKILLLPA